MARVIAVANHKGGVGKTTSVAALGSIFAEEGRRTLLVDLDAQANLTASFMAEEPEQTIYNAFKGEIPLPVIHVRENLDLIASSLDMAAAELELSGRMSREHILRKLLKPVADNYEFILLDCPPSLGLVTINAMVAATELFIPLTAEALPSRGLTKLTNILQMVRENLNESITLSGIIITRWEPTKLSKMVEQQLRATFGETIYKTKIRKNVAIAEAPLYAKDIVTYAPDSNGARDYRALADEITGLASEYGEIGGLIFSKEFGEDEYTIGEYVGEPNHNGEQDYRGYSISPTGLSVIADGEDFLADDEVETLQNGGAYGLLRRNRRTLGRMRRLYEETKARLTALGYPDLSYLTDDEVESLPDEAAIPKAREILQDAIAAARRIIEKGE